MLAGTVVTTWQVPHKYMRVCLPSSGCWQALFLLPLSKHHRTRQCLCTLVDPGRHCSYYHSASATQIHTGVSPSSGSWPALGANVTINKIKDLKNTHYLQKGFNSNRRLFCFLFQMGWCVKIIQDWRWWKKAHCICLSASVMTESFLSAATGSTFTFVSHKYQG